MEESKLTLDVDDAIVALSVCTAALDKTKWRYEDDGVSYDTIHQKIDDAIAAVIGQSGLANIKTFVG